MYGQNEKYEKVKWKEFLYKVQNGLWFVGSVHNLPAVGGTAKPA
jgi:hypothetical protein